MPPDLLTASTTPSGTGYARRLRAAALETALPIALSSLAAGAWAELAFFHHHGKASAVLISILLALCSAACFSIVVVVVLIASKRKHGATSIVGGRGSLRQQLARCSFSSVVLLLFLPEYLARLAPPLLRSGLLLAIATLLWAALCAVCIRRDRGATDSRITAKTAHRLAAAGLLFLMGLTTALAIRKYLVFGYVGQDLAYFGQIMHTTLHGHLFWGNLLQDLIYSRPVSSDFAGHNSPVMFLFLPFYAVFPSPVTLLVLRNLVMLGCAAPVFLMARRGTSTAVAWLWTAAFLLTPAILYQSTFDFYPLSMVALPLLFTLYYYLEKRYTAFVVALICTLMVREDLVFFAFGMGLLALLHRRSPRWWLVPLTVATAWAAFSFFVVLPAALHGATFVTDACFSHLGGNPGQMVRSIVFHPRDNVLIHGNLVYLKTLLTATGLVLSLGSFVTLLSLPYLAINLLAGAGRCITTVIFAQYSVIPAALLFVGALLTETRRPAASRLSRLGTLGLGSAAVPPLLLVALCCGSLVFVTGEPQLKELRTRPWDAEARQVLRLIPAGASVAAPRYMLPHLANRDCLYQTHRLLQYHTAAYEYLIFDTDWNHINASDDYRAQYAQVGRLAASDPALRVIYTSPQYRVYWNSAMSGRGCSPPAPVPGDAAGRP